MSRLKGKKYILMIAFVWLLGLPFFLPRTTSYADDNTNIDDIKRRISEKEKEKKNLENEKKQIQQGKRNVQGFIADLEGKKDELYGMIGDLDNEVAQIEENIGELNKKIEDKEMEIETTRKELIAAEEVALEQYNAMKVRIRYMYERGENYYAEILLGAESFGDFLNKSEYVQMLNEYDRNKLNEYQYVVDNVRATKEVLEEEEAVLDETRQAAQEEEENINALIEEKKKQIEEFKQQIADQEELIAQYEAEEAAQAAVIAAVEAQLAAERNALAEAERIHYNGGKFCWPAPDYVRISSPYGYRIHPISGVSKLHAGVDLASGMGTRILAAYDGKVIAAGYNGSMGNYVMIDHGDGLVTVYMHASALLVSSGQKVSRGQQIAKVGSTGNSTGPHLHFAVRLNGAYVDPMPYLRG